jgi:hypothetical protein
MSKIKYLSYVLLGLSALFSLYVLFLSGDMSLAKWKLDPGLSAFKTLDGYLIWAYILVGVSILLAIVFSIVNMIRNPKNIMKTLISFGLMVAVVVVAYLAGSAYVPEGALTTITKPADTVIRWVDAGLIAMYILTAVAALAIVAGGVRNLIKNR